MSGFLRVGMLSVGCIVLASANAQTIQRLTPVADPFAGLGDVKIEYYDVGGTDETSINASLAANAPTRPDGRQAMGHTGYFFQLAEIQHKPGPVCTIAKATITLTSTVRLPRLTSEALVPERIMVR